MLTAEDLREKYRIVPGQVTVTFTGKHPERAGFTVAGARKRPLKRQGVWTQGIHLDTDKVQWILPAENMRGVVPERGDFITYAGTDWLIDDLETGLIEAEFKCLCTQGRTNA